MRVPLPRVVSGDQIASFALRYQGAGYVFGGNASHPGLWDCSSFCSFVLHGVGLPLPGGRWGGPGMPPVSHGPTVESYAAWRGALTVNSPARGDLVLFVGQGASGHMGIVLGPDQMMSALDSAQGTLVTPITGYGPPGAPIVYRRVLGAAAGGVPAAVAAAAPGGLQGAALALLAVGVMAGVVLLGAVVLGTGVAIAGSWAASRMVSDA